MSVATNAHTPSTDGSRIDPRQLRRMTWCERLIFRTIARVNRRGGLLLAIRRYWQYTLGFCFVDPFFRRVTEVVHPEVFRDLPPDRAVIVVANHLTFYDLFAISYAQYRINWAPRIGYYPVRANFFYDNILGLLVNLCMAGGGMWPPIYRDRRLARMNPVSIRIVAELARDPLSFIGLHPEGKRNRTGDPYRLLPGRRGAGKMMLAAWDLNAVIIPVFMRGLHPWFPVQLWNSLTRREPLHIIAGTPLDLASFAAAPRNAATCQAAIDFAMERIAALGQEERALRYQ